MPITIEGHGTVYTEAEVKAAFLPKDRHEAIITERIEAKNKVIAKLEGQVLDYRAQVDQANPLVDELNALKAELAQTRDMEAYRTAGILTGDEKRDAETIEFMQMAHRHAISKMEAPPEDPAAHYRQWLTADDGAKASPYLGAIFKAAPAQPPAATAPQNPAAPPAPPAPPPPGIPNTGTGTADPAGNQRLTRDQIQQRQSELNRMRRNIRTDADRAAFNQALATFAQETGAAI